MSVKSTGIVKFTLDPNRPPALTKKVEARLAALSDRDIDLTDIPSTYGVPWKRPGSLVPKENKRQITLRIDADVLDFFQKTGRRYQTRINEVLRSYMNVHRQSKDSQGRRAR
ncbi:MAG: BrnA antitoxin family protein [Bryobacteraceae bacterium]|nr:BrnA antitoxin family protein [Bryobacteraceae bacterium]